tara:strand:- start:309 stop:461 length:153 start_codon:yes stop_codon:yes gene_type:complete
MNSITPKEKFIERLRLKKKEARLNHFLEIKLQGLAYSKNQIIYKNQLIVR